MNNNQQGDNDSDLSIINQIEPEQDVDDFTDLDIDLDDERDYVPQRAQIDQARLQEFLRGLRNIQMVVPPQSDAVSSAQTQVNIPGTDDPRFRLDEGLSQQILQHFTGMIQRSSRENDQRRNLSEAYKKCDRQFKKFLAQEFKEELALDTKMKSDSVQALDAQGLVVKLVDGEFVRGLEYDDEFDLTTLSVRFPFEYFKRPILKSRTQIILTSSDTAKRALFRVRENQIRGSIVESKDGNIVLNFFGQLKVAAFDQLSMIEISPDLETSQRVKLFIDNFPNLITNQTNQLTRNMSEYLTLDAEEFSADTWRFLLTNQRELDPANLVDIAVRSGPEAIRREIPVSKNLNVSQMQALTSCLKNNGVYLLHGPPGTGKSKTLVSLIAAYLKAGKRILVCCHTNQAVDKLLIDTHKLGILYPGLDLRIGDTGQNDRQCLQYTIRRFVSKAHKKGIIGMNGRTRDEFERSMLTNARSVFATLTGTFRTNFLRTFEGTIPFDAVIIDEASQAPLVHSMMPLMFARRLVLAGDHKQLPPCLAFQSQRMDIFGAMFGAMGATNSTNLSPEEEAFYKQSLFERMLTKNLLKTFPRAGELSDRLKNFNPSDFLVSHELTSEDRQHADNTVSYERVDQFGQFGTLLQEPVVCPPIEPKVGVVNK